MATEWRGRLRLAGTVVGIVWLALLAYEVAQAARFVVHDCEWLRSVGAATVAERASQLKPWPWKAPLSGWTFGGYMIAAAACVGACVAAAIRRALARDDEA